MVLYGSSACAGNRSRDIQDHAPPNLAVDYTALRADMVDGLRHESKGVISSAAVELAMGAVPRHEFVDDDRRAYADVSHEQFGTRVLAPSTVARLFETLSIDAEDTVLIVGAGVGYTAAVAAEVTEPAQVHAIDIARQLVVTARSNLDTADYPAVLVDCQDGMYGLSDYAPYDRILVEAAAVRPPEPLLRQLAPEGRLVMPLGTAPQTLTIVSATNDQTELGTISFAPLLVDGEQSGTIERNRTHREERERSQRAHRRRNGWEHDWIDWE